MRLTLDEKDSFSYILDIFSFSFFASPSTGAYPVQLFTDMT
jgi:hypothetical protein